jgi:Kef-type K+ transport system membrane component KefB
VIAFIPVAAEAPLPDAGSLVLVLAAASAGAILSRVHRRIVLPTVVLEIVLGILIGPEGLDLAQVDSHIDFLADLGLVFLFFFAGLELIEQRVARRSLVRGTGGWAISLAIGLGVGHLEPGRTRRRSQRSAWRSPPPPSGHWC